MSVSMVELSHPALIELIHLCLQTVVRIFDCLLVEGPAILFGVSLTLLREREQQLLQIDNYGDAFEVFKNIGEFSHDPAHVMKVSIRFI